MRRTVDQIVVTGGAGFIGSHLVDRLIEQTNADKGLQFAQAALNARCARWIRTARPGVQSVPASVRLRTMQEIEPH